jgi:hypothetical protein
VEYVQKQVSKKFSKAIEKRAKFDFIRRNSQESTTLSMSALSSYIYRNPTLFAKILRSYFIYISFVQFSYYKMILVMILSQENEEALAH